MILFLNNQLCPKKTKIDLKTKKSLNYFQIFFLEVYFLITFLWQIILFLYFCNNLCSVKFHQRHNKYEVSLRN